MRVSSNGLVRKRVAFALIALVFFAIDQILKVVVLHLAKEANPIFQSTVIDIVLVFNKGVAFSLFSFIGGYLKWILLALLCVMIVAIIKNGDFFTRYYIALGAIIGAGFGNLIDRFVHNGVVDYVYWHFGFKFAVFNLADATINVCIAFIIIHHLYIEYKRRKNA